MSRDFLNMLAKTYSVESWVTEQIKGPLVLLIVLAFVALLAALGVLAYVAYLVSESAKCLFAVLIVITYGAGTKMARLGEKVLEVIKTLSPSIASWVIQKHLPKQDKQKSKASSK